MESEKAYLSLGSAVRVCEMLLHERSESAIAEGSGPGLGRPGPGRHSGRRCRSVPAHAAQGSPVHGQERGSLSDNLRASSGHATPERCVCIDEEGPDVSVLRCPGDDARGIHDPDAGCWSWSQAQRGVPVGPSIAQVLRKAHAETATVGGSGAHRITCAQENRQGGTCLCNRMDHDSKSLAAIVMDLRTHCTPAPPALHHRRSRDKDPRPTHTLLRLSHAMALPFILARLPPTAHILSLPCYVSSLPLLTSAMTDRDSGETQCS